MSPTYSVVIKQCIRRCPELVVQIDGGLPLLQLELRGDQLQSRRGGGRTVVDHAFASRLTDEYPAPRNAKVFVIARSCESERDVGPFPPVFEVTVDEAAGCGAVNYRRVGERHDLLAVVPPNADKWRIPRVASHSIALTCGGVG